MFPPSAQLSRVLGLQRSCCKSSFRQIVLIRRAAEVVFSCSNLIGRCRSVFAEQQTHRVRLELRGRRVPPLSLHLRPLWVLDQSQASDQLPASPWQHEAGGKSTCCLMKTQRFSALQCFCDQLVSCSQCGCVCFVLQERSEVFQQFSVSQSGVLLCTVGVSVLF